MQSKLITQAGALKLSKFYKIAMVSGSFDLLHAGHLHLLKMAKELTSDAKLFVLVLDDANIKRRKGPERPINPLRLRVEQLQENKNVDYILPWLEEWEKIAEFVANFKPAYFIAVCNDPGIDSKRKTIEKYGGKLIIIEKLPGYSTSNLIQN